MDVQTSGNHALTNYIAYDIILAHPFDYHFFSSLVFARGTRPHQGIEMPAPGGVNEIRPEQIRLLDGLPSSSISLLPSWSSGRAEWPTYFLPNSPTNYHLIYNRKSFPNFQVRFFFVPAPCPQDRAQGECQPFGLASI